ncbi:AAA family ATPase [Desulfococcaceae bacterium HSG9]|nr:AAA family ATPase [Desulfococcaceae bacterium HSG9]
MKKIIRSPAPSWFPGELKKWKQENNILNEFRFSRRQYQMLLNALSSMTQHHCSFCDEYLSDKEKMIVHFKPVSLFPLFPLEAKEWENLFLCCTDCHAAKSTQFDKRLIKPDDPNYQFDKFFEIDLKTGELHPRGSEENYIRMGATFKINLATGKLNPRGSEENRKRAAITISIFKLNGYERPQARLNALRAYQQKYSEYEPLKVNEYSYRFFIEESCNLPRPFQPKFEEKNGIVDINIYAMLKVDKIRIKNIKISNIKCFSAAEINFNAHDDNALIIGVNGVGKSTILQLLAIGLRGIKRMPFPYNWKKVVKTGHQTGQFQITLQESYQTVNQPLTTFAFEIDEKDTITCVEGQDYLSVRKNDLLIAGYGAGRHIKLEDVSAFEDIEPVATLFGENGYLKHIKSSATYKSVSENFDEIRPLINAVLDRADDHFKVFWVNYDSDSLYFKTPFNTDDTIPIEALSEGFKSTFIWLFDMIIRIVETGGDISNAHQIMGIVLIDEIDLHLHPVWQRTILMGLEDVFPNIQFIATTHSPLVAQTVKKDNWVILDTDDVGHDVKVIDKNITSELSYSAIIREIFDIRSPFSKKIELELHKFRKMRDALLKNEDIDEAEFKNLINKIAHKGVETEGVMRREVAQLERQTGREFNL